MTIREYALAGCVLFVGGFIARILAEFNFSILCIIPVGIILGLGAVILVLNKR